MTTNNRSVKEDSINSEELLENAKYAIRHLFWTQANNLLMPDGYRLEINNSSVFKIEKASKNGPAVYVYKDTNHDISVRIELKFSHPDNAHQFAYFDYFLLATGNFDTKDMFLGGETVYMGDLIFKDTNPLTNIKTKAEENLPMDLNKNTVYLIGPPSNKSDFVTQKNLKLLYFNKVRTAIAKKLTQHGAGFQLLRMEERAFGYMEEITKSNRKDNLKKLKELQNKYPHITSIDPDRLEKHFDHLDAEKEGFRKRYGYGDGKHNAFEAYVDILLIMTILVELSRPNFFTMNHYMEMFNIDFITLRALISIKAGHSYTEK